LPDSLSGTITRPRIVSVCWHRHCAGHARHHLQRRDLAVLTADAQRATAWAHTAFAASAALWFLILLATAMLGMLLMQ
jgi:hypothetical protein